MENKIEITGVDLVKFAQKVYQLSIPRGMGFLHFEAGGLSEVDAKEIVKRCEKDPRIALDMDYVHGRGCKMVVFKEDGKLFIRKAWYDHADLDLDELLSHFHIEVPEEKPEHSMACDCADCKMKVRK